MTEAIRVWVVLESVDYDAEQVAAVYPSEALADAHVAELGGWIAECEVLNALVSDATDPAKQKERQDERHAMRQQYAARQAEEDRQAIARANVKPYPNMSLCDCPTFSRDNRWLNDYGYCSYCGGFTLAVFRKYRGEAALQAEIDKLAIDDRLILRKLAASLPPEPSTARP